MPLIGYGTAPLGKEQITREHAVRCLNHAIDLGITYLDTSPGYGSEPHLGEVHAPPAGRGLPGHQGRPAQQGRACCDEVQESLRRLQTDHVDLIQVHAVNAMADLEQALAPDGAVTALEQARDAGQVRFIGITGHARPEVLGHALTRYPFDTVLVALGVADRLVTGPETFVLPRAAERNAGVIAMKVLGHGTYPDRALALRYSLGLPGVSLAIVGMDTPQQIDEWWPSLRSFRPLSEDELARLIDGVRPLVERDAQDSQKGKSDLFWLHDTAVSGWQQEDEPLLVAY